MKNIVLIAFDILTFTYMSYYITLAILFESHGSTPLTEREGRLLIYKMTFQAARGHHCLQSCRCSGHWADTVWGWCNKEQPRWYVAYLIIDNNLMGYCSILSTGLEVYIEVYIGTSGILVFYNGIHFIICITFVEGFILVSQSVISIIVCPISSSLV